jgi:hypothetical protein
LSAPVLEGACQHRLADSLEQVTNNVVDQPIPLRVVHNVAVQGAGLTPVERSFMAIARHTPAETTS